MKAQGRFYLLEDITGARIAIELTFSLVVLLPSSRTKSPQFWQFPPPPTSLI